MAERIRVLVTAVGGGVGQAVLRALRCGSLPYDVVGVDASPWSTGLYTADKGYLVPSARSGEAFRARILDICRKESITILIPGSDPELQPLAEMAGDLRALGCQVVVSAPGCIAICRDKLATHAFFAARGLPFAATVPYADRARLIQEKGYPLVVKPAGGSASVQVEVIAAEDAWGPEADYSGFIVQEYLVPRSWGKAKQELVEADVRARGQLRQEDEVSIQLLLDREGAIFGSFTSVNGLRNGVPINVWPQAVPEAEAAARGMARALVDQGLFGPCNFQCKLTETGPVFFEINPRFTGITGVRAGMGFNECEAMIRILGGESTAAVSPSLSFSLDALAVRYITDAVIPKADFERMVAEGAAEGSGRSISL